MDWKAKLTSRKLWVAVSEFIGMLLVAFGVAEDTVTQVVAIIMAGAGALAVSAVCSYCEGETCPKLGHGSTLFRQVGSLSAQTRRMTAAPFMCDQRVWDAAQQAGM